MALLSSPNEPESVSEGSHMNGDSSMTNHVDLHDMLTLGVGLLQQNQVMQCIELLDALCRSTTNQSIPLQISANDQSCIRSSLVKTAQYWVDTGGEVVDKGQSDRASSKTISENGASSRNGVSWAQKVSTSPAPLTEETSQIVPQPNDPAAPKKLNNKFTKSFAKTMALPWLPDESHGGLVKRCFILFEDPSASVCGKILAVFVMTIIGFSTASFMMESMPEYRETPSECAERSAAGLDPTILACEPRPSPTFATLEMVCIVIFSIEYLVRILAVHSTAADGQNDIVVIAGDEDQDSTPTHSQTNKRVSGLQHTWNYAKKSLNVIDFMAIMPFYLELVIGGEGGGGKMAVIRVLRLARVFRIFKMGKSSTGMQMLAEVLLMSRPALLLLMFFNFILMIVFGSLLYHVEGSEFSVAAEFTQPDADTCGGVIDAPHPMGVFVRKTGETSYEVTPFRNIPVAMWWVCTTMTTVGYGDISPTTKLGKTLGIACFYCGIIMLALPIAVLGANFEMVYRQHTKRKSMEQRLSAIEAGINIDELPDPSNENESSSCSSSDNGDDPRSTPWVPSAPGIRKKIFLLFEAAGASKIGRIISLVMMSAILVSTWSFILESMEDFSKTPDTCDPENLTVEDCEPKPDGAFKHIDVACIIVFTVDYLCRILTVHSAEPHECDLHNGDVQKSRHKGLRITWLYASQKMNLLDFCAIAPFYIEQAQGGAGGSGGFAVLRVLRLIRVFRVLKMKKLRSGVEMLMKVLSESFPALSFLFFMSMLTCVLFSSCMFFAEGTWFSVEHFREEYPNGLYVRPTIDGHGIEPSPFRSIPYAFWWFFQTVTTVGYGDLAPTTTAGRFVGICSFYAGMILLALPVTILGGNFTKHYYKWTKDLETEYEYDELEATKKLEMK